MARCKDEACNEVERLPEGAAIAESSLSEDDYLEKSRTFPLRVNEMLLLLWQVQRCSESFFLQDETQLAERFFAWRVLNLRFLCLRFCSRVVFACSVCVRLVSCVTSVLLQS